MNLTGLVKFSRRPCAGTDVGREINALFDINDLPTALLGFAAFIFNCGVLEQKNSVVACLSDFVGSCSYLKSLKLGL